MAGEVTLKRVLAKSGPDACNGCYFNVKDPGVGIGCLAAKMKDMYDSQYNCAVTEGQSVVDYIFVKDTGLWD